MLADAILYYINIVVGPLTWAPACRIDSTFAEHSSCFPLSFKDRSVCYLVVFGDLVRTTILHIVDLVWSGRVIGQWNRFHFCPGGDRLLFLWWILGFSNSVSRDTVSLGCLSQDKQWLRCLVEQSTRCVENHPMLSFWKLTKRTGIPTGWLLWIKPMQFELTEGLVSCGSNIGSAQRVFRGFGLFCAND